MGWFKQQTLSWIIVFAAATCASSQELTSTLRDRSHACPYEEVIFTCTIRGSANVTTLILAWSSTEYIEQNNLQFTSQDSPGTTRTSMINGNVTAHATLTRNTDIDGEPVLVSELRIIADQASTVTCTSVTLRSNMSEVFTISDVPEAPLNAKAIVPVTDIFENGCEIIVGWDPPANSVDITNYIVYVPALNVDATTNSLITSLLLRHCPERFSMTIAAINRFGCIGINSSEVNVTLASTSESNQLSAGAIAGITIAVVLVVTVCICILSGVIIVYIYCHFKNKIPKKKDAQSMEMAKQ